MVTMNVKVEKRIIGEINGWGNGERGAWKLGRGKFVTNVHCVLYEHKNRGCLLKILMVS